MHSGPEGAVVGVFLMFWCFGLLLGVAQLAMGVTAVIQAVKSALPVE